MTPPTRSVAPTPSTVAAVRFKRQLRNLLIDRSYQLRFMLVLTVLSASLTLALSAMVYHFLREASKVVAIRAMDPADTDAQMLQQQLARDDRIVMYVLVGFGVLLVIVVAALALVASHKVAGPLFKVAFYMNRIRENRLGRLTDLRRGDQLLQFFGTFRAMHTALGERAREELDMIQKTLDEVEKAGLDDAAARLRTLAARKREFLSES